MFPNAPQVSPSSYLITSTATHALSLIIKNKILVILIVSFL